MRTAREIIDLIHEAAIREWKATDVGVVGQDDNGGMLVNEGFNFALKVEDREYFITVEDITAMDDGEALDVSDEEEPGTSFL